MANGPFNGKPLEWIRTGVLLVNVLLVPVGLYIINQLDDIKSRDAKTASRLSAIEANRWTSRDAADLMRFITEEHRDIREDIANCRNVAR